MFLNHSIKACYIFLFSVFWAVTDKSSSHICHRERQDASKTAGQFFSLICMLIKSQKRQTKRSPEKRQSPRKQPTAAWAISQAGFIMQQIHNVTCIRPWRVYCGHTETSHAGQRNVVGGGWHWIVMKMRSDRKRYKHRSLFHLGGSGKIVQSYEFLGLKKKAWPSISMLCQQTFITRAGCGVGRKNQCIRHREKWWCHHKRWCGITRSCSAICFFMEALFTFCWVVLEK